MPFHWIIQRKKPDLQYPSEQSRTEQLQLCFFFWKKKKKKSWLTDWDCLRFRQVLSSAGWCVNSPQCLRVCQSPQEKTRLVLLLRHIHDPLRFDCLGEVDSESGLVLLQLSSRELFFYLIALFKKKWWQCLWRNLALRADRALPGLTFAGQESFGLRDKNASDVPDRGNNCGNLWFVSWACKRFALNDSVCLFLWIFLTSSSLFFLGQERSCKTFLHLSHRLFLLPNPRAEGCTSLETCMCVYVCACSVIYFQIDLNCFWNCHLSDSAGLLSVRLSFCELVIFVLIHNRG